MSLACFLVLVDIEEEEEGQSEHDSFYMTVLFFLVNVKQEDKSELESLCDCVLLVEVEDDELGAIIVVVVADAEEG